MHKQSLENTPTTKTFYTKDKFKNRSRTTKTSYTKDKFKDRSRTKQIYT